MENDKDIKVYGEKVQKIIGKIPSSVERYGISVIGVVILFIFALSMIIPYTDTITFTIRFNPDISKNTGIAYVEPEYIDFMQADINVKIYVNDEIVQGNIITVSDKRENGKYMMGVKLSESDEITVSDDLKAQIVTRDRSIFEMILVLN